MISSPSESDEEEEDDKTSILSLEGPMLACFGAAMSLECLEAGGDAASTLGARDSFGSLRLEREEALLYSFPPGISSSEVYPCRPSLNGARTESDSRGSDCNECCKGKGPEWWCECPSFAYDLAGSEGSLTLTGAEGGLLDDVKGGRETVSSSLSSSRVGLL